MVGLSSTVPRPFDAFIGRAEELQAIRTLLATHRLVTLTGAAGIGKTRLALKVAEELASSYSDGVCFVPLVELTDSTLVPQTVVSALRLREQPDRSLLQTLLDFLASRTMLLVWDNGDYVVEGCRALAQALLGACPHVKILATSRRSLRFRGETLYTVPPFSIPEAHLIGARGETPAELILAYEAPRLFKERAGEILTGFAIRPEDATAVAQICRRLDGIPLAVELAAGRVRELSVQQIASRLDERFHLLTSDASLSTHQQTIWNAIDWSNELLSQAEQTLLARLSVFAGGWDLEAAEQVCSDLGLPTDQNSTQNPESKNQKNADVLDLLTRLIDKSLVVGETGQGVRRYRFLETIREYSRERLAASGEEAELRARHAEYFLKLALEADAELTRLIRATWLDRLEKEYENLRAALAWCLAEETRAETALRLARALARFWEMRGSLSEGRAFLAEALARDGAVGATRARAGALNAAAVLAWMQGDAGTARALFDESLVIERSSGDSSGVAWSLHHLGHVASERGEYEMAQGLYEESLAIFRELGNQRGIAVSLADQGNMALKQGHLDTARSFYGESLRISRELGNKVSVAVALNNLGKISREQGDDPAARALHTESLLIRRELGDRGGYPWSLEAFARLAAPVDPRRAARLWGAAEALRESLGLPLPPNEREEYERHRSAVREALGQELFADAWSQGRTMTPEQAAEYALHETEPRLDHAVADPAPALPPLATKLAPPALSPSLLPRPRLTARLNRAAPAGGRSARFALLDASPGSGKSSLVSQWYHQQPAGTVAWLSLDREDNDPARFLLSLCAAIETVAPAATPPVRSLLQAANRTSLEPALTLLLNGVSLLEQPVALVLDDYHAIEAAPVHRLLAFLVEHLPPTLFLILTTRSDPPLPLARLRLQGQLIEIRDDELRFTHEEATRFLNEQMGLSLTPEMVKRLANQTEGWIAGLQMAALSLQGEADPAGFLEAFAGTNRFLMDYLLEEVLRRQPPEVQAFLGQTAFLDRLCGPLCDAVTALPDGQAMLERLEAANLFLIPLDRERRWYRYHQLFADVLRSRLLPHEAGQIAVMHGRAAAWYEAEGMAAEAIEHALAAGQFERAAPLIEQLYESVWQPGLARRLERWLQALPPALVRARPYLAYVLAMLHNYYFRVGEAEQVLNDCRFEPEDDTPASRDLQGRLVMARGWTARLQGDKERAARLSEQALELLPAGSHGFRSYARFNLGMLHQESGDLSAAGAAFADAIREAEQASHYVLRVRATYGLGQLREIQGALNEAARLYHEALEYARARHIGHTPAAALLYAGLGRISVQRNDLPAAAASLAEGLDRVDSALPETNPIYAVPGLFELLRLQAARGEPSAADTLFERLAELARAMPVPLLDPVLALWQVRKQGAPPDLTAAWLAAFEARTAGEPLPSLPIPEVRVPDIGGLEIITWAQLRLTQGDTPAIEAGLERFLQALTNQGRHGSAIEVRVLLATLHWQAGRQEQAVAVLEPALALAEQEGYVRVCLEAGPALIPVLRQAAAQGIAPETVGRLLAGSAGVPPASAAPSALPTGSSFPALIEPLSDRELEVLRLVAAGLPNKEIAAQLYLAVGTVKRHVFNLYGKLGATSRTSAVARARELGLL